MRLLQALFSDTHQVDSVPHIVGHNLAPEPVAAAASRKGHICLRSLGTWNGGHVTHAWVL